MNLIRICLTVSSTLQAAWPARAETLGEFDFVIIGGGTSGLTVANRLSELEEITVAVVEAGSDERNNPNVTNLDEFGLGIGTRIDWAYQSVNQAYAANQTLAYSAGKALGGTSTINGMTYIRAEDVQIDVWEKIGNRGWNWANLLPYYKKSESFQIPSKDQVDAGASYEEAYHGYEGYLDVGYPLKLTNGSFSNVVQATWENRGFPFNEDVNSGHVRGFSVWPMTVDRDKNVREDAARAYYHPIEGRANLKVFNGIVSRILWKDQEVEKSDSTAVADGVEFISPDGATQSIRATTEVIVSAGALRSPAILELSGVGNPNILEKHGVKTKVSLPAVGENLQDQPNNSIMYQGKEIILGKGPYATFATITDILGDETAAIAASTRAKLGEWARAVSDASDGVISAESLEYLFTLQHDLIFQKNVPFFELLTTNYNDRLASVFWGLLPFSRGSVHIGSADPLEYPLINPNFFLVDFDLLPQVALAKEARKFWATEPASEIAVTEIMPGLSEVPENATDEEWEAWLKASFISNSHPVGTLAMMPRELGGVVDDTLLVYGTKNVRVVDASVLPFQVSGHLTSTLYAVSEKAADIIKAFH
ncbi:hypothetical protein VTO42DRAFT_8318 [Malbranchea cinnamomea]